MTTATATAMRTTRGDEDKKPGGGLTVSASKEDGRSRWLDFLRRRFVSGDDVDFDYGPVDANDSLDVLERRDREDHWFDDEKPSWTGPHDHGGEPSKAGETGVQDY